MTKRVIIMIGLPKSGKSTWVEFFKTLEQASVCSADHYFTDGMGVYDFRPDELPDAHRECLLGFLTELEHGTSTVIVDNTNMTNWERSPYVSLAQAFGYDVVLVHVTTDAETCKSRENGHGVPDEVVDAMAERYEEPLSFWGPIMEVES